ncbi:hypothetical protein ACFL5H_03030, partial [Candidatus Latescibacterota bacterium]
RKGQHPRGKETDGKKSSDKSPDDKGKPDNDKGGGGDGDDSIPKRRTRIIRLKIGGRRRTIKKAPAQKIRRIK